ncbi:hypothetical protein VNO78_11896 [Psophocarpus tetragonolobus]|uniref:Uncharacterized protein n=1 Tax=Psophocarpus tetragonolobus TaxID=3891 RepID=A0AAN9XPE3_PSOTE
MAMTRFWFCTILILAFVVVISQSRSLPSSFQSHTTKSDSQLGADRISIEAISGLKLNGMEIIKYNINRLSPGGPDPHHHP